jgi:signal peptidase I
MSSDRPGGPADVVPGDEPRKPEDAADGASPRRSRRRGEAKKGSLLRELPVLLLVAFVLALVVKTFFVQAFFIPSGSMEQTLHGCTGCTGDRILVDRITYDFTDPRPGDVIVFKGPEAWTQNEVLPADTSNVVVKAMRGLGSLIGFAPPDERDFVKRVIATPGQTVQCCDTQNRVIVDGKALDEPYIHWETGQPQKQVDFAPVRVPAGKLWVMGDNRNNSSDSRFQGTGGDTGTIPIANVIGKARVIVLPPGRWGGVSDHNPQQNAQPAVLSAASWQQDLPLGVGVAAAWPTVFFGRKLGAGLRKAAKRKR